MRTADRSSALSSRVPDGVAASSEIASMVAGAGFRDCIQCGTCSAVCPMSAYMEYTPRRLIAMARAGFEDDVLRSRAIWVCTSCYACTVECPKEVPITDVIYTLKRTAMRGHLYPRRFPAPVMVRAFVASVDDWGRSTESWISVSLYLRTRPLELLRNAPLALRLLRTGRMSFRRESIRDRRQIRRMLAALETTAGVAA